MTIGLVMFPFRRFTDGSKVVARLAEMLQRKRFHSDASQMEAKHTPLAILKAVLEGFHSDASQMEAKRY